MSPPEKRKPGLGTRAAATTNRHQPEAYNENVTTVGEVVAAILDAVIPGDVPRDLHDVVRLRSATRRVLEARLPAEDEDYLLAALARQAARAQFPLWALDAMEREILPDEPPELLPPDVVGRARTLRLWGHEACPTCRQSLIREYEIDRDDRRRRWAADDREVRRQAVPEGLAS